MIVKLIGVLEISWFVVFLPSLVWLALFLFWFGVYIFVHIMAEKETKKWRT